MEKLIRACKGFLKSAGRKSTAAKRLRLAIKTNDILKIKSAYRDALKMRRDGQRTM